METQEIQETGRSRTNEQPGDFLQESDKQCGQYSENPVGTSLVQPRYDSIELHPMYVFETRKPVGITDRLSLLKNALLQFYLLVKYKIADDLKEEIINENTHPAIAFIILIHYFEKTTKDKIYLEFDENMKLLSINEPTEIDYEYWGYAIDVQFYFLFKRRKHLQDVWYQIFSVIVNHFHCPNLWNQEVECQIEMIEDADDWDDEEDQKAIVFEYRTFTQKFGISIQGNKDCLKKFIAYANDPLRGNSPEIKETNRIIGLIMELIDLKFDLNDAVFYDIDEWNNTGEPSFDADRYGLRWKNDDIVLRYQDEWWSDRANNIGIVPLCEFYQTKISNGETINEKNGMKDMIGKLRTLHETITEFGISILKKYGKYHPPPDSKG